MNYIFMDESGDLGFNFNKEKTSQNFIIATLITKNKRPTEKIISKIFNSLSLRVRKSHSGVLHCNKEKPHTRIKLLTLLNKNADNSVVTICINKRKIPLKLQKNKLFLYSYITKILLDRIFTAKLLPINEPINFIASRRETNHVSNSYFTNYITNKILDKHRLKINVSLKRPCDEKSLQAVDFISWSSFRNYEFGEDNYYNLVKDIRLKGNRRNTCAAIRF